MGRNEEYYMHTYYLYNMLSIITIDEFYKFKITDNTLNKYYIGIHSQHISINLMLKLITIHYQYGITW